MAFTGESEAGRRCPYAIGVHRQTALAFAACLETRRVTANGCGGSVRSTNHTFAPAI
jgi:hypothetical protein